MIYLHTLGDTLIKVDEKEIRPTSPLMFAALLYLGLERGRRVPRAALQEMLFAKSDERSGAHSLRQLLYKLRHLGAPLEVDPSSVLLRADHVQDDLSANLPLTNGRSELAAQYALGLVPGYEPELSPRYGEWLEQQRSSASAAVRRQLVVAMSESRASVDWVAVERLARLVLQIDPFNEEATLALAEVTALQGSKSEAVTMLTQYEREIGRSDLKLPASVLRRRISERLPDLARPNRSVPFVGREEDFEVVGGEITRARCGESRQLVVAGEPGIGKSRLLDEVMRFAALEGMQVHVARCQPHHAVRPMGVFIDLVPALLSCQGALGIAPETLSYLNLLVSHKEDRYDRPTDSRDDISRSEVLFAAVRDLIEAIASETPLVLAVEDVHWADPASLRELGVLSAPGQSRPVLVVLTTRFVDQILRSGAIVESSTVRRLMPLDDDVMAQLARHLLHGSTAVPGGDIEQWCTRLAAGNPLFLHSLCAHFVSTGEPFAVPNDIKALIAHRLNQLPPRFNRVLQFCSLLGRHASLDAIRSLTNLTEPELLDAFSRLENEGFLSLRDNTVCASHSLLSDCALEMIPPVTRRLMHSSAAALLELHYGRTKDASLLWDCAEQWRLSGESDKASQFLRSCARHASDMGRAAQAISLLTEAKDLVRHNSDVAVVLRELIAASKAAGQWVAAHEYSRQLDRLPADNPLDHSDTELLSIEASWMMNFEAGNAPLRLLKCAEAQDAPANHRFDAALIVLKIAHERGDLEMGHRAYRAIEPLEKEDHQFYSARFSPLVYHTTFGDRERALALAQDLTDTLKTLEPITYRLRAGLNLGIALTFLGRADEAKHALELMHDTAARLGMTAWQVEAASSLCWLNDQIEDADAAFRWHGVVTSLVDAAGMGPVLLRKHKAFACEFALQRGDLEEATRAFEELRQLGAAESVRAACYFRCFPVRVQLLDPTAVPSIDATNELETLFFEVRSLLGFDYLAVALGESLRRRGEHTKASHLLEEYVAHHRRERLPLLPSLVALQQVLMAQCA